MMEPAPRSSPAVHSDEIFRLIVSSVRDYAIFMLDPSGHVRTWNAGAERIKGYRANEIIGKYFGVFYPPDAIARGWPEYELERAAADGRFEDEGWRIRQDGSRFWANIVLTALRTDDGRLIGFAKITRDLTERKEQEERLRESEERFRLIVESVEDYAIFMLDPSGRIVSWNRGAERMNGYAAGEIIGDHFSRLFPVSEIENGRPEMELREALQRGRVEYEGWRIRKDGSRFWANVIVTTLTDSKGQHRGFAKITRDLTQRQQVAELAESNRRVNEFLAMLAHELRNPLAPIRNALNVLEATTVETTSEWAREVIDRQATHLTRLVDDLLDISRISSGKITLRFESVDLNEIVLRAVEAARPLADAKQHHLLVTLAPEPVIVDGDVTRLSQVIVNLLNNAAKYTPDRGHVEVVVQRAGRTGMVAVRDNGIGIAASLLPRIFDLFAQGDRSLARSEGGLGIGLTLARRLVEMHHGHIIATSPGLNLGSQFTIRLPVTTQQAGGSDSPPSPGLNSSSPCRVLVVDDNEDSANTMAMLLKLAGHKARVALDGRAALAAAADFKPHVVLLDIGLPEMNGYEVARQLQEMPDLRDAVLVAMTGYGQEEDRRRSRDAGFAHHLVKPVDPAVLQRVIASGACES